MPNQKCTEIFFHSTQAIIFYERPFTRYRVTGTDLENSLENGNSAITFTLFKIFSSNFVYLCMKTY